MEIGVVDHDLVDAPSTHFPVSALLNREVFMCFMKYEPSSMQMF
jgi:hypothetical protein